MAFVGVRTMVKDTPTKLTSAAQQSHESLVICNRSTVPLDLGGPNVATGQGFQLDAGDTISVDAETGEELYIVGPDNTNHRVDVLLQGVKS